MTLHLLQRLVFAQNQVAHFTMPERERRKYEEKLRIERENAEMLKKQELQQEAEKLANSCEDKLIYNPTNYICPEFSHWKAIPGSSGTCQSISTAGQSTTFHKDYKELFDAAQIKYNVLKPDKIYPKIAGYSAILTEFQVYPVRPGSYKIIKGCTVESHRLSDKVYFEISQEQSQNKTGPLYTIEFHKDICPL